MRYIRVHWQHDEPTEPIQVISEVDPNDWEIRKVELFADGRVGVADRDHETESTWLSIEQVPADQDIAADPQFTLESIDAETFKSIWNRAGQTAKSRE